MRNIKRQGVLLGAGLLSVTSVVGLSQVAPAEARDNGRRGNRGDVREERKDVKEARKDVRRERKDVRKADTPAERREAREDVRDARQDLRRERQDLRHDRRGNRQHGNNGYGNNNDWRYRQDRRNDNYGRNNGGYNGGYQYGGPRYDNPHYDENIHGDMRTLEGTVTNDLSGNNFTLRLTNGQLLRVRSQIGEPSQLSRGDYVRVFGYSSNGIFYARGLRVLNNR